MQQRLAIDQLDGLTFGEPLGRLCEAAACDENSLASGAMGGHGAIELAHLGFSNSPDAVLLALDEVLRAVPALKDQVHAAITAATTPDLADSKSSAPVGVCHKLLELSPIHGPHFLDCSGAPRATAAKALTHLPADNPEDSNAPEERSSKKADQPEYPANAVHRLGRKPSQVRAARGKCQPDYDPRGRCLPRYFKKKSDHLIDEGTILSLPSSQRSFSKEGYFQLAMSLNDFPVGSFRMEIVSVMVICSHFRASLTKSA